MRDLDILVDMIGGDNAQRCRRLLQEEEQRLREAPGSSYNHQAWKGGYVDHVVDCMNIAITLYEPMRSFRHVPFVLEDALLVMFLHDVEKPWRKDYLLMFPQDEKPVWNKRTRKRVRDIIIARYGFELTSQQENALRYVEGEGDDYRSDARVMNELAAFCHMCDVASARIWWNRT